MLKTRKYLGLSGIAASFVFLFNPNLNIIDILPDFIGYAILVISLSCLSDLNEDIALARKRFGYMIIADVVKLLSLFIVFGAPSVDEQNSMLLLVAFVFATVEIFLLFSAYGALFGGLMGLGYRFENNSVLASKGYGYQKNKTEKMRSFTLFFVVLKAAAYVLPEFTVLSTHSYDEGSRVVYIYEFVGLLRGFAMLVCMTIGIIWLARIIGYFKSLKNDACFVDALNEEYRTNILPKESLFVRKWVKLISLLFCLSALLCIDFRVEYINVLPDVLSAAVLIIAAIASKKYAQGSKKYTSAFVAYALVSLVFIIIEYGFFSEYYYSAVYRSDEAYSAYCVMLSVSLFKIATFMLSVFAMGMILKSIINNHTGFYVPTSSINVSDKVERVHSELKKKLYLLYAGGALAAASDIFCDFGAIRFRFAYFVNTVCTLIFFVCVYKVTNAIGDEVESKYMLE